MICKSYCSKFVNFTVCCFMISYLEKFCCILNDIETTVKTIWLLGDLKNKFFKLLINHYQ